MKDVAQQPKKSNWVNILSTESKNWTLKGEEIRGKKILEQLSRTLFFTGFENPALSFPAT